VVAAEKYEKNPLFLMDFVLVALCGLSTFQTEIMINKSEFPGNRTTPAGTTLVF
jgi:hypothetical protein